MEEIMILVGLIGFALSLMSLLARKRRRQKMAIPVIGVCVSTVLMVVGTLILIQVSQAGSSSWSVPDEYAGLWRSGISKEKIWTPTVL